MPVYDQYGRTDNYMTGALPYRSMAGGPVRGSKTDRGVRTEFVRPQNQATDQVAYKSSPGLSSRSVQTVAVDPFTGTPLTAGGMNSRDVIADIPGPAPSAPSSTVNAATPLDGYRLALTPTPPSAAPLSPAVAAINTASPTMRPGVPMSERIPGDWQLQAWLNKGSIMPSPAVNNPAAAIAGNPQVAQAMAANEARTPSPAPRQISPEVHARLMAQQSPRASREQRIADAFRTDGVVAHRYADDADFLRNNTPGGRPDERALMREAQQAVMRAAKAPQAAPARISPVVHAALMAQQQRQSPAGQAAIDAGKRSYVVSKSRNGSENALMPTRTISGAIRNTYGD